MTDSVGPDNAPRTVVWWRQRFRKVDLGPQDHRVGWATPDGQHAGSFTIRTHHLRLDGVSIERELRRHLLGEFDPGFRLVEAGSADVRVGPEVELMMAGHHIVEADLFETYGPDVLAGVSAQLLGRGCSAIIAFDRHLSTSVREAIAARTVAELAAFDAPAAELEQRGWSRTDRGRWELLLVQR